MKITKEQEDILLHTLGYDGRTEKPYRNHFAASEGTQDHKDILELCKKGLMRYIGVSSYLFYAVTDKGQVLAATIYKDRKTK